MKSAHTNSVHGQSGSQLTRNLALAQEIAAQVDALETGDNLPTLFRIYTEDQKGMSQVVAKRFDSASLIPVSGLWKGNVESGLIVEIVGVYGDRRNVLKLAGDIAERYVQSVVLVTWQNGRTFDKANVYGAARAVAV